MPWLFLAYPLLAHLATLLRSEALAGIALTVFAGVPLLPALRRGTGSAWLALSVVAAGLYVASRSGWARYLMYLPPVLIPLSVLWVFARSLVTPHIPIVTQVARQIRGELPPELTTYTRHVTQCWVALLSMMALCSLLLALFASTELWSLMTNVVLYVVMGAAFLFEYIYRRWRFRHLQHESFATLVAALLTTRMQ